MPTSSSTWPSLPCSSWRYCGVDASSRARYFVCATNWLHDSLPGYARVIAPLHDKLNSERNRIGRRNRNALSVATTWTPAEEAVFTSVVALVADSTLMSFPDPDAELFLFTDASANGDEGFVFPTPDDIIAAQQAALRELSRLQVDSEEVDGVVMISNRIWIPMVKDGLSHFCELFPCATPTAYIAAEALTLWYARYGMPDTLQFDQGTHFRNEMLKNLSARLKIELSFSPVYSPWLNGTVERLNKDVLQVFRALLMEYSLDQHEWSYLLPAVEANLNHTRVHSLADRSPVEVFTALPASSVLDAIVVPATGERCERMVELNDIGEQVDRLRSSLHAMHQEVADVKERQRLRDMAAHNGNPANFDVGDFVLWSRIDRRLPNHKLLGHWVGPFKVVAALPHSFEIEHLVTERKYEVHASRLKFYADSDLDTTTELLELV
ncbi:unnamed protein product [Phytophthora fragariaefolia]|uniref:Unnamed protein product n=1 Tax=Phytophthora fragariaefolia TaxID=1490495 RepID=A0A9W6XKX1_9STRA|nr:unnamed protein product [Phytophthora fragariaefolia]